MKNNQKQSNAAKFSDKLVPNIVEVQARLMVQIRSAMENKARLERAIEDMRSRSKFYDALIDPDDAWSLEKVATALGTEEHQLFAFLINVGLLVKRGLNLPYQKYIDRGYFTAKLQLYPTSRGTKMVPETSVTLKGLDFVRKKWETRLGSRESDDAPVENTSVPISVRPPFRLVGGSEGDWLFQAYIAAHDCSP